MNWHRVSANERQASCVPSHLLKHQHFHMPTRSGGANRIPLRTLICTDPDNQELSRTPVNTGDSASQRMGVFYAGWNRLVSPAFAQSRKKRGCSEELCCIKGTRGAAQEGLIQPTVQCARTKAIFFLMVQENW